MVIKYISKIDFHKDRHIDLHKGKQCSILIVRKLWRSHDHANDYSDSSFLVEEDVLGTWRQRNIVRFLGYYKFNVHLGVHAKLKLGRSVAEKGGFTKHVG